jgi:DNA gyrase subunit A
MGVTLLRLNDGERVTSCFPVLDSDGDNGQESPAAGPAAAAGVAADGVVDGSEEAP